MPILPPTCPNDGRHMEVRYVDGPGPSGYQVWACRWCGVAYPAEKAPMAGNIQCTRCGGELDTADDGQLCYSCQNTQHDNDPPRTGWE